MRVRTSSVSDVADGISDMRIGRVQVEVLSIPTVRKLDGAVEVRVLGARANTCREATLSSLVPRGSFVTNPLSDSVHVCRSMLLRGTDIGIPSSHTETFGELERLAHLASAGIDVVDLVSIGLETL